MIDYSPDEKDRSRIEMNYLFIKIFIVFFFFIITSRLWYLQIIQGEEFHEFSNKNLLKSLDVHPVRGRIYDRHGQVLAENLPTYKVIIIPQYVDELEKMAEDLGQTLNLDPLAIVKKVKKSRQQNDPFFSVDIKKHLTYDEIFKVELMKLEYGGLSIQEFVLRHYPYSDQLAHILGYVREVSKREIPILTKHYGNKIKPKDIIGKQGLEKALDFELRGKKGLSFVVVDAKGRHQSQIKNQVIQPFPKDIPPETGDDIHTTLDIELQQKAFQAFKKFKRVGSLIAMTPKGEILAWISYPSPDPNLFSTGVSTRVWNQWMTDPGHPLRNKAIQDHYPPGSTFKPIVALAGLQQKIITAHDVVDSPATYQLGPRTWHDHSKEGYGFINVIKALERSSNVFFYKLGKKLGPDKMALYAKAFGLGSITGVPIAGEAEGHIPTREWKQKRWKEPWQEGESLNMSIGQGQVLVTTIQLAQVYSGIALHGAIYQPQIIKKTVGTDKEKGSLEEVSKPILIRHLSGDTQAKYFIHKKYFETVKQGLWQVVNGREGTAKQTRFKKPFSVSGKTGTAQVKNFSSSQIHKSCFQRPKSEKHNGWFVGYGSVNDEPKITVAVLTESSCTSAASVPIAREVFKAYFQKYHGDLAHISHKPSTKETRPLVHTFHKPFTEDAALQEVDDESKH